MKLFIAMITAAALAACSIGGPADAAKVKFRTIEVLALDPRFDQLVANTDSAEVVIDGLRWAEGPVWIEEDGGYLLATDVPGNRIHRWSRKDGARVFLEPSGVAGEAAAGFREPGANGLFPASKPGSVLVANHGLRAIAALDLATKSYEILSDSYGGAPLNSPNDLVLASDGTIYFTDPPYGLEGIDASPKKVQAANGVYRRTPDGAVDLLISDLTFPNGVGLSPDEAKLYIGVSDPKGPLIIEYDLRTDDIAASGRIIHDGAKDLAKGAPGLPDGLAVDASGNIFATATGGVHVFAPDRTLLGVIHTGTANANCAIGEGGAALYIAAKNQVLRLPLGGGETE